MGQSLSPFHPVGPHYLWCRQSPQLPATLPSNAPAPQFPNVGHLRMCHRRVEKQWQGRAARAATDLAGNQGVGRHRYLL